MNDMNLYLFGWDIIACFIVSFLIGFLLCFAITWIYDALQGQIGYYEYKKRWEKELKEKMQGKPCYIDENGDLQEYKE